MKLWLARLPERLCILGVQGALLLPFVTSRGCQGTDPPRDFSGVELYALPDARPVAAVLAVLVVLLVVRPFRGESPKSAAQSVIGLAFRCEIAVLGALLVSFAPALLLMFEQLSPHVGWFLHGLGWAIMALGYGVAGAVLFARTGFCAPAFPEVVGLILLVSVTPLTLLAHVAIVSVEMEDLAVAAMVGALVAAPLVLAGLGLVQARRDGDNMMLSGWFWWASVGVFVTANVAAAFG